MSLGQLMLLRVKPILGCWGVLWASVASAQIGVAPIRVDFSEGKTTATVIVSNESNRTMVMQPTGVLWGQDADGKDQFTTTRDLIVAPPVIEVPAKQKQTIRVALRAIEPKDRERQYRLVVREVPPTAADGTTSFLQFAINLSLPVIAYPKPASQPSAISLSGRYDRDKNFALVTLKNDSDSLAQIKSIKLNLGGQPVAQMGTMFYVLPGITRVVEIPFSTTQAGRLSATKQLSAEISTARDVLTREFTLN